MASTLPALDVRFGDVFMDFKGSSPWAVLYGILGTTYICGQGVLTAVYIGGPLTAGMQFCCHDAGLIAEAHVRDHPLTRTIGAGTVVSGSCQLQVLGLVCLLWPKQMQGNFKGFLHSSLPTPPAASLMMPSQRWRPQSELRHASLSWW
jgi:hypothetical protein